MIPQAFKRTVGYAQPALRGQGGPIMTGSEDPARKFVARAMSFIEAIFPLSFGAVLLAMVAALAMAVG